MNSNFENDLGDRLTAFIQNASFETLSAAFEKANFDGYRNLRGSFFGITDGSNEILVQATEPVKMTSQATTVIDLVQVMSSFLPTFEAEPEKAADHQDLALAA